MTGKASDIMEQLQAMQQGKDIDEVGKLLHSVVVLYGLTVDEVAALAYYMLDSALQVPANKALLKDRMALDVDELGIDAKLSVMRALVVLYSERAAKDGKAKR